MILKYQLNLDKMNYLLKALICSKSFGGGAKLGEIQNQVPIDHGQNTVFPQVLQSYCHF